MMYEVLYGKPTGLYKNWAWKKTLQEADALAEKLEHIGFDVEIWRHDGAETLKLYPKSEDAKN